MKKIIKVGEKVKIISGQDKGKIGLIKKTLKQKNQIIVAGVNLKIKHTKPVKEGDTGEIKRKEYPIHSSNVVHCKE
ncbi:unnamed protein product [Discosporangium mesarthrocarpum]